MRRQMEMTLRADVVGGVEPAVRTRIEDLPPEVMARHAQRERRLSGGGRRLSGSGNEDERQEEGHFSGGHFSVIVSVLFVSIGPATTCLPEPGQKTSTSSTVAWFPRPK